MSDDLEAFSPEEVWALVRAAGSEQDAALFLTAAFTGLRMGELLALQLARRELLRPSDPGPAQLQHSRWPRDAQVRQGAVGADGPRRREDIAALANRDEFVGDEELVFPNALGRFQDASSLRVRYKAALGRAGLRPLRFHDLRHTFGTLAVRMAEVPAAQAWMGHANIQTTMRYVHHRDRGDEARLLAKAFSVEDVPAPEVRWR